MEYLKSVFTSPDSATQTHPGKRPRDQMSLGSSPSPHSKSLKMAKSSHDLIAMRNMVLNVNSHEDAGQAIAEFQSLSLEDKVDNVFSVLLDLRISVSSTTTAHHDHPSPQINPRHFVKQLHIQTHCTFSTLCTYSTHCPHQFTAHHQQVALDIPNPLHIPNEHINSPNALHIQIHCMLKINPL